MIAFRITLCALATTLLPFAALSEASAADQGVAWVSGRGGIRGYHPSVLDDVPPPPTTTSDQLRAHPSPRATAPLRKVIAIADPKGATSPRGPLTTFKSGK